MIHNPNANLRRKREDLDALPCYHFRLMWEAK